MQNNFVWSNVWVTVGHKMIILRWSKGCTCGTPVSLVVRWKNGWADLELRHKNWVENTTVMGAGPGTKVGPMVRKVMDSYAKNNPRYWHTCNFSARYETSVAEGEFTCW